MRARFTLVKRTLKNPKPHTVYYYRLGGDTRRTLYSTGQTSRAAAEEWVRALQARPAGADITLEEYTRVFFVWGKCPWIERQQAQGHDFSKTVARMRRAHLTRYILPVFGKYKLTEIKANMIFNFLVRLKIEKKSGDRIEKVPMSNQTKNHIKYTFAIVMDAAVFDELIEYNPLKNVKGFADTHEKRDIFTDDELARLFPEDLVPIWKEGLFWPTFFFTLLTAGMRLSEGRALAWGSIDWEIPAVSITRAVKAEGEIGTTKSREQRAALLPARTLALLRAWRVESRHTAENDLVFYGETGQVPFSKKTPWKYFERALERAKIPREGRKLVIHSLRHTYDTKLREAISEAALQYMIGHKDKRMTDRYDQATPLDKLRRFLPEQDKFDQAWR